MNKLLIIFICLILFPLQAWGTSVQAVVDRTVVSRDESLSLRVTINDGSGDVDTSVITDFDIVSKNSGSNISLINGKMNRSKEYTYTLVPRKTGSLVIPALPVTMASGTLRTQPIRITVTNQPVSQGNSLASGISLKATISSPKIYTGQQVIYTVSIYQTINMADARLQEPAFTGFTAKKLDGQKTFTLTDTRNQIMHGQVVRVTQIMYMLTPLKPGTQTINPAILSCDLIRQDRSRPLSDDFFGNNPFFPNQHRMHKAFQSNPITVHILSLPQRSGTNQPYSGLIGTFSIKASVDRTHLTTNDSATLTITVSGTGNVADANLPTFKAPANCKIYPDEPVTTTQTNATGTTGKKVFTLALVPTHTGTITLPQITLNWFNPHTRKFETASSSPLTLEVTRPQGTTGQTMSDTGQNTMVRALAPRVQKPAKENVTLLHKGIRPLHEDLTAITNKAQLSYKIFLLAMLLPILTFGCILLGHKECKRSEHPSKRFARKATKLLKEAHKAQGEKVYATCSKSLMAAIASRTHTMSQSLTYDETQKLITHITGDKNLAIRTRNLMLALDTARYGTSDNDVARATTLINQTANIVREISA